MLHQLQLTAVWHVASSSEESYYYVLKLIRSCDIGNQGGKSLKIEWTWTPCYRVHHRLECQWQKVKGVSLYGGENAPVHLRKTLVCNMNGPSEYNSDMLQVQSEFESCSATFQTSHCHILRTHRTRAERWVMLRLLLVSIIYIYNKHSYWLFHPMSESNRFLMQYEIYKPYILKRCINCTTGLFTKDKHLLINAQMGLLMFMVNIPLTREMFTIA